MMPLSHFDLSLGYVTTVEQPPRLSRDAAELVQLVGRNNGAIPVALGWNCRVGRLQDEHGIARPGAAHMALEFGGLGHEQVLAVVGICCWLEVTSLPAWKHACRMRRPLQMPGPDQHDVSLAPPVPWLATMQMPLAARLPAREIAEGVNCAAELAWALITLDFAGP